MTNFWTLVTLGEACRTRFLRVQFSMAPLALLIRIFLFGAVGMFLFRLVLRLLFEVSFVSPWFSFHDAINVRWIRLESAIKNVLLLFHRLSCLAKFVAFSRVRFGSSWSFSESSRFCNPTTIWSQMSSSFSMPKLQYLGLPCQDIQICDKTIHRFSRSLTSWVKFYSLKDDISFHDEVIFEFFLLLFFSCSPVNSSEMKIPSACLNPLCKLMCLLDFRRFVYQAQ